jgi:hypothetical protein
LDRRVELQQADNNCLHCDEHKQYQRRGFNGEIAGSLRFVLRRLREVYARYFFARERRRLPQKRSKRRTDFQAILIQRAKISRFHRLECLRWLEQCLPGKGDDVWIPVRQ